MDRYLDDAVQMVRDWDNARPRTRQTEPGWSNMADCRSWIGFRVAGEWPTDHVDTWRPSAGTALHTWFTHLRRRHCHEQGIPAAFGVPVTYRGVPGTADEVLWPVEPGGRWEVTDWKGLALDTPIPTPAGWTTMGAVRVGDQVFGSDGRPCAVIAKSGPKQIGTYIVRFGDGAEVVCDREHLWWAMRWPVGWRSMSGGVRSRKTLADGVMEVVGVEDMAATIRLPNGQVNWRVPVAGPLILPSAELPVTPYVLGCWLGDGDSAGGRICNQEELFTEIEAEGWALGPVQQVNSDVAFIRNVIGLRTKLRLAGILFNKHVPDQYLRASSAQRTALVQGLMDTDGTWNRKRHRAVFITTSKLLASAMAELLSSLGEKPSAEWRPVTGFGVTVNRCAIEWTPSRFNPFRIPAKADLVTVSSLQLTRASWRTVIAITPGPDVVTACIGVDSPDRTYLCGQEMIPTHNTPRLASIRLWNDDQFLDELFIQPHGYAAGLLEPGARQYAEQTLTSRGQPAEYWSAYDLDPDACVVRLLGAPVDGTFEDWQAHLRPFSKEVADDAVDRYQDVIAAQAAGETLPQDKPPFFCERWCEFVSLCRGFDRDVAKGPLPLVTDPELAAAIRAYGLASELIGANEKIRKEIRPLIEGGRGVTQDGWKIYHARGNPPKMITDDVAVEQLLGSRGIPLSEVQRWGPPGQPKLTVTRVKKGGSDAASLPGVPASWPRSPTTPASPRDRVPRCLRPARPRCRPGSTSWSYAACRPPRSTTTAAFTSTSRGRPPAMPTPRSRNASAACGACISAMTAR